MSKLNVAAIIILLSTALSSCSRDQKVVKWLGDGTWLQTSSTINGVEHDPGGTLTLTHSYKECEVKDADCMGSQDFTLVGILGYEFTGGSTFLYRIHEKGTKITFTTLTLFADGITQDCDTTDCVSTWNILEMEKERHVISRVDDNGDTRIKSFEKI